MADLVKVKFRLQGERDGVELNPQTLPWPLYREFTDRLLKAMQAMNGGPRSRDVAVAAVEAGSVCPSYYVPRETLKAVYRLRRGPRSTWSTSERRGAEPLYEFTRQHALTMECGVRKLHSVVVPTKEEPWTLTEHTTLLGGLRRLGGTRTFTAEVDFDRFGTLIDCRTTRDIAEDMAQMLFKRVELAGLLQRDMATGTVLSFQITGAKLIKPVQLRSWRARALELLDGGLDPSETDVYIEDYG